MNADVSRSEEILPIILLIIISIVRPFVPGSFVWGLAIAQLVLLIRAIPRHDWNTVHHITLFVNPIFRDSWHPSMAVDLPRAGPFVLGIAPEFPAVTPNRRMVAHGPPDAADVDCRRNRRSGFCCVSSGLV